jgi:hypothetical protein
VLSFIAFEHTQLPSAGLSPKNTQANIIGKLKDLATVKIYELITI